MKAFLEKLALDWFKHKLDTERNHIEQEIVLFSAYLRKAGAKLAAKEAKLGTIARGSLKTLLTEARTLYDESSATVHQLMTTL